MCHYRQPFLSQDFDDVKRYRSSSSRDSLIFITVSRSTRATLCHQKVERSFDFIEDLKYSTLYCRQCVGPTGHKES